MKQSIEDDIYSDIYSPTDSLDYPVPDICGDIYLYPAKDSKIQIKPGFIKEIIRIVMMITWEIVIYLIPVSLFLLVWYQISIGIV